MASQDMESTSAANKDNRGAVPSWLEKLLSTDGAWAIETAVEKAEALTSGEIVPVIVRRSAELKFPRMLLSAIFVLLFGLYYESTAHVWIDYSVILVACVGAVVSGLVGFLIAGLPVVRRLIMMNGDAPRLAAMRAEIEFCRAGIGRTESNTGILLFLSVEDHQAVVLADKGISSQLPPETWDHVLSLMLDGLRRGACADGMVAAIAKCGELLAARFPIRAGDKNELHNHLRIIE